MKVWEAINILESLDPKSEVTLVLGKPAKTKESIYERTYVIGKEMWPAPYNPNTDPFYNKNIITCTDTRH